MRLPTLVLALFAALAASLAGAPRAHATGTATQTTLCLLNGPEPRKLGVYDTTAACVPMMELNSATHTIGLASGLAAANLGRPLLESYAQISDVSDCEAFQRAVVANPNGGVALPNRRVEMGTASVACHVDIQTGMNFYGFPPNDWGTAGTVIHVPNATSSPFEIHGTTATGFGIHDVAVRQEQPTPTSYAWVPTAYPPVFNVHDVGGSTTFHLRGSAAYTLIQSVNSGRLNVDAEAECFIYCVYDDLSLDTDHIVYLRNWPYWSSYISVAAEHYTARWKMLNTDTLVMGRVDTPKVDEVLSLHTRSAVKLSNAGNGRTTRASFGHIQMDGGGCAVWFSADVGATAASDNHFDQIDGFHLDSTTGGTTTAAGSSTICFDPGTSGNIMQVSQIRSDYAALSGINLQGTFNSVVVDNMIADFWGYGGAGTEALLHVPNSGNNQIFVSHLTVNGLSSTVYTNATTDNVCYVTNTGPVQDEFCSVSMRTYSGAAGADRCVTPARWMTTTQLADVIAGTLTQDVTTPLQSWLSSIVTGKQYCFIPGLYKFTSGLSVPYGPQRFSLTGPGVGLAQLVYYGAATNIDLLTIGNTTDGAANVNTAMVEIGGFMIRPQQTTTMTAGAAFHLGQLDRSLVRDVRCGGGPEYYTNAWNCIRFNGVHQSTLSHAVAIAYHDGVVVRGINSSSNADLTIDHSYLNQSGNAGLHATGGFGGLFVGVGTELLGNLARGVLVDNSEPSAYSPGMREVILESGAVVDGANGATTGACVELNDPSSNLATFVSHGYIGSCHGHGIHVVAWPNGLVNVASGRVFNNGGNGVENDEPTLRLVAGAGATIDTNTGWGVDASVATPNASIASVMWGNSGGNVGANITNTFTVLNNLSAPALPTSGGTVKGSICVDTAGKVYVKTTAGACL